ncbi:MAG: thioesterase family protein [Pseudomonadota bacterium]
MTDAHALDIATAIRPLGAGRWSGETSPDYLNIVGPFGGVIAATLLRAVLEDGAAHGDPASMTVNFCAAIKTGSFEIATKCVRTGKHTQHWMLELNQEDETRATATVLMGVRRETFAYDVVKMPEAPAYESVEPLTNAAFTPWVQCYEFRFFDGEMTLAPAPLDPPRSPRTRMWVKDAPDRLLDYLGLAALSDSFFFRLLHARGALIPNGTVSLTPISTARARKSPRKAPRRY